jgi:ubiquinol-cytochrome c reductase cytochrome c1 subunit
MIKSRTILAAVLTGLMLSTAALAQDAPAPAATNTPAAQGSAPAAKAPASAGNAAAAPSQPGTAPQAAAPTAGTAAPSGSANNAENASSSANAAPAATATEEPQVPLQSWSFAGIFGRYDQNQLRRGFQVFKEVCSSCHSAHLFAFRNLSEPGGPEYSAAQVKALAATYTIADPDAPGGKRPGLPSDYWPSPFPTEKDARDANGGALPPDWSVLAEARGAKRDFPWWVFDYFTTYQEGGPDYVHALLNGYHETPPAGFNLPAGKYYNDYFPGHAIGMPPPLSDGLVKYAAGADGSTVPETVDQYSRDAAAFMMWLADPSLDQRKESGFRVIIFLIVFAVLMWLVKRRIWANVEH